MSKELVVKQDINEQHALSVIEQVVMQGDLSKLNPEQRVTYYHKVCESVGLNPYTRPFDYISLNGKLTLYAKKDATEQLRQVKNISITQLDGRMVDDLYIVVAKARTPNGRTDEATGAVSIGSLRGEQKANAIMKAETKAKRRVTLSISGMGWTDESEIENIPNAEHVEVDIFTGEIKEKVNKKEPLQLEKTEEVKISNDQAEELKKVLSECSEEYKKQVWKTLKDMIPPIKSLNDVPKSAFDALMKAALKNRMEYQASLAKADLEEIDAEVK